MPALTDKAEISALVKRRSPEWIENQKHWRFLADSREGGNRYRHADYVIDPTLPWQPSLGSSVVIGQAGTSPLGSYDSTTGQASPFGYLQIVDRNLVPHLSETGDEGKDTYLLRLARTPVPKTFERVINRHLARIYAREVKRSGGESITEWWEDVDGMGTKIDKWMRKVVAPLLMTYGCIDVCFDRPKPENAAEIMTRADARDAGLDRCDASYILPENMVWWRLDRRRRYTECLVLERDDGGQPRYRHWTGEDSVLYGISGKAKDEWEAIEEVVHPFGRPPIVRLFDERKLRSKNVGQPRYESVAELQKAIYNTWSELILSDILQSGPLLQGPKEFLQGDAKVSVGPDQVLPMAVTPDGQPFGWSYVAPPKGAAEAQLQHIGEFTDMADRDAALLKPAGATTGGTVAQSGLSKSFDSQEGNDYLAEVAETLGDSEKVIVSMVLLVLSDGKVDEGDIKGTTIEYPKEFDLFTASDLSDAIADIQALAASAGALPQTEGELFDRLLRVLLPGLGDKEMEGLRAEIDAFIAGKNEDREMAREAGQIGSIDQSQDEQLGYDNVQSNVTLAGQATS